MEATRRAHNPKAAGSNPISAAKRKAIGGPVSRSRASGQQYKFCSAQCESPDMMTVAELVSGELRVIRWRNGSNILSPLGHTRCCGAFGWCPFGRHLPKSVGKEAVKPSG